MPEEDPIKLRASSLLRKLWDLQTERTGVKPTHDSFYPVALPSIVQDILGWRLQPLGSLPQRARCDFENHIIFVDTDERSPGKQNYSIAHEIGHVVLHRNVANCSGGVLERPKKPVGSHRRAVSNTRGKEMYGVEVEADEFARELLMPEKAVRLEFAEIFGCARLVLNSPQMQLLFNVSGLTKDAAKARAAQYASSPRKKSLSDFFGASPAAMAIRLGELALIQEV